MKKVIIGLSIVLAIGTLIGIKKSQKAEALEVVVSVSEKGTLEESILASGNFVHSTNVQIRSEVTGRVIEVLVDEGQYVEQGEVLIRLDDSAFKARVTRSEAQLKSQEVALERNQEVFAINQRRLQRHQQLASQNLVNEDTIDDLKTQLRIAELDIKAAQQNLEQAQASLKEAHQELAKTEFVAPIAGVVTHVGVKQGETVVAGTTNMIGSALMELADPSSLEVELRVDEADIGNVNVGQQVNVFSAVAPQQAIAATISEISPTAKRLKQNRGLVMVLRVTLDEHEQTLYAGMSCRAEIIYGHSQSSVHIPIAALIQHSNKENDYYVWAVKNNRASRVNVTLGVANDTQQALLSGLDEGETIVTGPGRALYSIRENMILETINISGSL